MAGLVIIAGLALASTLLALSPRLAARVGRWRWPLVGTGVAALLAVVCFVGVGTREYELRLVLAAELHAQVAEPEPLLVATEAAMQVALGDEFLTYAARRFQLEPPSPGLVREHVKLVPIRRGELDPAGEFVRRPREAATALALEYAATTADPLVELKPNEHAAAHALIERVAHHLDELVLVELYRRARSDDERRTALLLLRGEAPAFPEWVARELATLAADVSPGLATALAEVRAEVARAVDPRVPVAP